MGNPTDLQKFIEAHSNWRELLSQEPYYLTIKDDGPYCIFNYNQIKSDFSISLVQEARGLVFRIDNGVKLVCMAFQKFFNYSEPNAHPIDWASAKIQEKVDGSIIKVWYDEGWHVSTNGVIDAFKTDLQLPTAEFKSFGELFMTAWKNSTSFDFDYLLSKDYTSIFELVSPFNRVVVPYKDITTYTIGCRNNFTGKEYPFTLPAFNAPKVYSFASFEDMIESTKTLPYSQEGYVVVDKDYNRVKVKSLAYLRVHHLKDNGNVNLKRVLELVKLNEIDEYLSYFPEYTEIFTGVKNRYDNTMKMISEIKEEVISLRNQYASNRKGFALRVLEKPVKLRKYYFVAYDGNEAKFEKMIDDISIDDLL